MKRVNRVVTILTAICLPFFVHGQNKDYRLEYKFKTGEVLKYHTERHDSTKANFAGQTMDMPMTLWSIQSVKIVDAKPGSFRLTISTDTTWSDQTGAAVTGGMVFMQGGSGQRSGAQSSSGPGRRTMEMGGPRERERNYEMNQLGVSLTKEPVATPLILPLPEKPIPLNGSWDFEYTLEMQGRSKGTTHVTGQCILYSVDKQDGKEIAVIVVNTERKSDREMQGNFNGIDISSKSTSASTGSVLVYFDIQNGRIIETVTDEIEETSIERSGTTSQMSRKSNSTTQLKTD